MTYTRQFGGTVCGLGHVLLVGCAAGAFSKDETPGQRFDRAMNDFADNYAKVKLKQNDRPCDRLKLKPADPLITEEGRFAHSIKIPNPVPEDSGYKQVMISQEYFGHVCETEAGEFIYKTVENVEGLYMMRPRKEATDDELSHLYAVEDPYGYNTEGSGGDARELLVRREGYAFLEERSPRPISSSAYRRYVAKYVDNKKTLLEEDRTTFGSQLG